MLIKTITMRKGKNTNSQDTRHIPEMKIISMDNEHVRIEREIDQYVQHIQWLIRKLTPSDRQKYYSGLLSYILSEPVNIPVKFKTPYRHVEHDYSKLTVNELQLIRELSSKMEELYRTMES
jgi:hypothetical protein